MSIPTGRSIAELRKAGTPLQGNIRVSILSGDGLAEKNKVTSNSDPYLVLTLTEGGKKTLHFKTEVEKGTVNPRWRKNTLFNFPINNDLPEGSTLTIECFDHEMIGFDHHMGQIVFKLDEMEHDFDCNNNPSRFNLEPHKAGDKVSGSLLFVIEYKNEKCWKDDEPARAEKRENFIKEMQAKSRAEESSRSAAGVDKVQHFVATNRKEGVENLRHTDYDAYVHLCRQNGSTPLPRP
eukprot:Phypoly_transcript_13497.p1 GENE.Phypoly_transcript_13497~~Phypoly_transcript_13497.p1  ORF type:complete len:236 (+),score=37.63 Phypoly_transcript_13497:322-1029(+)